MLRLEVLLNDLPVGELTKDTDLSYSFRFSNAYKESLRRPILGQRFEDNLDRIYKGKPGSLPAFFANLVPEEGMLRNLLGKHFNIRSGKDFDFLVALGGDLPGAVRILPEPDGTSVTTGGAAPEPESSTHPRSSDGGGTGLRFSLAGVQMKLSLVLANERLTLPGRDRLGRWIVKFDSAQYPKLPQNEHAMMEWAREAGFEVPECRLYPATSLDVPAAEHAPEGTSVLAVRRYDRRDSGTLRVHQEDFAQVIGYPPGLKYDHVKYEDMLTLSDRLMGRSAAQEFVRRLVLVVACGNNDAHLKNWSLLYPDGIQAQWTPLYDQISTLAWPRLDQGLALKLAATKSFRRLKMETFEVCAEKAGFPKAEMRTLVTTTLERLRAAWPNIQSRIELPDDHRDALEAHWRQVPVLKPFGPLSS